MQHSRRSRRIFSLLSMMILICGATLAPSRLAAQTVEPTANSVAATQSGDQAKPEAAKPEKKSEEEQTEAFLVDGPIVKWIAKTFNIEKKTASNICLYLNFGIVVLLIGVPLVRVLPKLLRGRGEKVRIDIDSARKATKDASARLNAIEAKLAGLDGEIAQIRAQVEADSLADETRIKATISEESARIVAAAEQEIGSSAAQARRSLRNFAADLAIEQAAKQLVLTPENDRALIAEFLGDAAVTGTAVKNATGKSAIKGGQN